MSYYEKILEEALNIVCKKYAGQLTGYNSWLDEYVEADPEEIKQNAIEQAKNKLGW